MSEKSATMNIYNDFDYGYGGSVTTDEDNNYDDGEDEVQLWNAFGCSEPTPNRGSMADKHCYEVLLQVIKFILYGLLLLVILVGSIIVKMSTLFATSQLSGHSIPYCNYDSEGNAQGQYESSLPNEARVPWVWCLIFAFSVPELLTFLGFIWNWFFYDIKLPKIQYIGLLTFVEILHTFGMALLFLVVIPDLDVIQGAALLTCVCVIPNILSILSKYGQEDKKKIMYADVIAICLQLLGIITFTCVALKSEKPFAPWVLPIALLLSSLRWWGNFVSSDSHFGFIRILVLAQRNLQAFRPVLIGYSSTIRIVTFILSALLITTWQGIDPKTFFEGFYMKSYDYTISSVQSSSDNVPDAERLNIPGSNYTLLPLWVFLINAIAGICVYNAAKFACRTLMQRVGFALPLNLAVPTTVAALWVFCSLRANDECFFHNSFISLPDHLFFSAPGIKDYATKWYSYTWVLWLLSQIWITLHIWTFVNIRLAKADKIFSVSSYDALVIDQSLALSRWRKEPEDDDYFKHVDENSNNSELEEDDTMVDEKDKVTKLFACATMWHERAEEMTDFFNSILRLDQEQGQMKRIKNKLRIRSRDYYELEVHIFFDDAFKCIHDCVGRCMHDENKTQVNDWVMDFVKVVEKCIKDRKMRTSPPIKYPTPYGGRLVWALPNKTPLYVHLKDKNRIRTRKRWSQVMYMYYLLGYRLIQLPISAERKTAISRNTYILTLDGDIDFKPSAVRTLIDRMKINSDLGSVCGRIHPLGKGPLVWFQKFEYAVGHWLQKATEHTIGCVLCSPGCFALFRAQALMEENVIRKYASVPKEASHYIQYDQGEDRWLCTLILQQGFRVEYSAASDAYTHAPEGFNEFFIQRRRWIPSTVANIMDLLESAEKTKKNNPDISSIYILYQWILMGSTILGPGTIFLMLVGAFVAAFGIDNWTSFVYNLIPVLIFCFVCYFCQEKTQLTVAAVITALYGLLMIVVLVGIIIQISEDGWLAPTTILFLIVIFEFLITGLLHPQEVGCLKYACIYYITVPSMYLLLIVFSLFNMNNINWGTRDNPKPPLSVQEIEEQQQKSQITNTDSRKKKEKGAIEFSLADLFKCMLCTQDRSHEYDSEYKELTTALIKIDKRLEEIETGSHKLRDANHYYHHRSDRSTEDEIKTNLTARKVDFVNGLSNDEDSLKSSEFDDSDDFDGADSIGGVSTAQESDSFLISPNWLHSKDLGKGEVEYLKQDEEDFWKQFIGTYLEPIDKDLKREANIAKQILDLRDQYVFKFFMINALFVVTIFLMQLKKDIIHIKWPFGMKYNITYDSESTEIHVYSEYLRLEPIGFVFILGFFFVLLIQFIAMLFHRFDTFSHIMAKARLNFNCCNKAFDLSEEAKDERVAEKLMRDNDRKLNAAKDNNNRAVPPRKRMTIKQTIDKSNKKHLVAKSFDSEFQKNLNKLAQTDGMLSKRLSRELNQKRQSAVALRRQEKEQEQQQQQQQQQPLPVQQRPHETIYEVANDELGQKQSPELVYEYDNQAFAIDETLDEKRI